MKPSDVDLLRMRANEYRAKQLQLESEAYAAEGDADLAAKYAGYAVSARDVAKQYREMAKNDLEYEEWMLSHGEVVS